MLNHLNKLKQEGFTIVELLIVIVVIAILAAISIVAYNGIQERSENTKTIQAATEWTKILASYAAIYGQYPTSTASPCLTQSGISCGRTSGANNCFGVGTTASNVNYIQEINKVVTTLPSFSSQEISCNGAAYRGIYTGISTGPNASVYYFLKGNQNCSTSGAAVSVTKLQQDDLTRCVLTLPTVS